MSQNEAFKVCVRIRPLNSKEQDQLPNQRKRITYKKLNENETVCQIECPSLSVLANEGQIEQKQFIFDNVFGETSTTEDLYKEQIQSMLSESISQGYNATIFAYGMTGAGKSYSMFGDLYNTNDEQQTYQKGIISFCIDQIFSDPNVQKIGMSFLEIYNEQIRDLICETQGASLMIVDDPIKQVVVQDASEIQVESTEQVRQLVSNGTMRRVMAPTQANVVSSRSHAILQFFIVSQKYTTKLSLVDLAGSERASVSENRGLRLQEGANINKSLLSLGNCINVLAEASTKGTKKTIFVPYRDSKLTRLLKDSLGGNTKTIMIGCVSPSLQCYEETLNTLKYASRARAIKKRVIQNIKSQIDYSEAGIVLSLQQEIMRLRLQLEQQPKLMKQPSQSSKDLVDRLMHVLEEQVQLKINLREIDEIQQLNQEGLKQQIGFLKQFEELGKQRVLQNDECCEYNQIKDEIEGFQRQIEENESIRYSVQQKLGQNSLEKKELEALFQNQTQSEDRDREQFIISLQREVEYMRKQLQEKDEIIAILRKQQQIIPITLGDVTPSENEATQRSLFQKNKQVEDCSSDKPFFSISMQQGCVQDVSFELECISQINEIADEHLDKGCTATVPHPTIRESRKGSCTTQVYPQTSKNVNQTDLGRTTMSARKGTDENPQLQNLVGLQQARANFKNFRTRLSSLRDQIQNSFQNNLSIQPNLIENIVQILHEIAESKYIVPQQDQNIVTMLQQLAQRYCKNNIYAVHQNHHLQPSLNPQSSRSKSATIARKKVSTSTHQQKPQQRQPLHTWNQVNQCGDLYQNSPIDQPKRLNGQGGLSNANRNYAQIVSKAKKSSKMKDSGVSQLLHQQAITKHKAHFINENSNVFVQKQSFKPPKKSVSRGQQNVNSSIKRIINPMASSNISPLYKHQQTSFSSIQEDMPKHYQRQIFQQASQEEFKSYNSKPPIIHHYVNIAQFSSD